MPSISLVRKALKKYKQMLVPDWSIVCAIEPLDDYCNADVNYDLHHKLATIRLAPYVIDEDVDFLVAHEVAHLLLVDYNFIVSQMMPHLTPAMQPIIFNMIEVQEERVVNNIAQILSNKTVAPTQPKINK